MNILSCFGNRCQPSFGRNHSHSRCHQRDPVSRLPDHFLNRCMCTHLRSGTGLQSSSHRIHSGNYLGQACPPTRHARRNPSCRESHTHIEDPCNHNHRYNHSCPEPRCQLRIHVHCRPNCTVSRSHNWHPRSWSGTRTHSYFVELFQWPSHGRCKSWCRAFLIRSCCHSIHHCNRRRSCCRRRILLVNHCRCNGHRREPCYRTRHPPNQHRRHSGNFLGPPSP